MIGFILTMFCMGIIMLIKNNLTYKATIKRNGLIFDYAMMDIDKGITKAEDYWKEYRTLSYDAIMWNPLTWTYKQIYKDHERLPNDRSFDI